MDIIWVTTIIGGISGAVYLTHFVYLQVKKIQGFRFTIGQVGRVYRRHFRSVEKHSPMPYVYQQAGKVYDELSRMNKNRDSQAIDHPLIYFIAGWAKEHLNNHGVRQMSQDEIASGIADQMLAYLHAGKKPVNMYRP